MDYINNWKSFLSSHYLNEGIRMTAGILVPAFLMLYFDLLSTGVIISLGAFFVSITDSPGPIHHRTNGMFVCNIAIFFVAIVSGLVNISPLLLGIVLLTFCFLFSMIGVYGVRANSIGIAALVLLVLDIGQQRQGSEIVEYAFLLVSGGLWYMSFSMLLYNFRPYKLIQQALGEWVQSIGTFLLLRAEFYKKDVEYEATSKRLLQQQAIVQEKQNVVSELIFKTRNIVKETTQTGRILVMMYVDAAEMFEKIMTSYQSYSAMHDYFDETGILETYRSLLTQIAEELDAIGIAIKSGAASQANITLQNDINATNERYQQLRQTFLKPGNINGFISIKRILDNIQDIADRLQTMHSYTTYDASVKKRKRHHIDGNAYVTYEPIKPRVLFDNLTLKSDIFRHSIRLSLAVMAGYIVSLFFTIGHSYWILLTIIVILKPAYSLTKKRNTDRLFGTIGGVLIGLLILTTVKNNTALLILMIVFMLGYFSTMRTNYFLSVLIMTPYVVLFFHLLYPGEFSSLLKDRVLDTAIGSVIAFAAIFFILPSWERQKIKPLMTLMLEEDLRYFTAIGEAFLGKNQLTPHDIQVARKNALVGLANLSDAFNRMLSEPKHQQAGIDDVHKFVVLNHMFTSYVASLSSSLKIDSKLYSSCELHNVIEDIKAFLLNALKNLQGDGNEFSSVDHKESLRQLNEQANELLNRRRSELEQGQLETATKNVLYEVKSLIDQFNLIYKASKDINKVSKTLVLPSM